MRGTACQAAGQAIRDLHQQRAGAAGHHHRAEDDEDQDIPRDDLKRRAKDTACIHPEGLGDEMKVLEEGIPRRPTTENGHRIGDESLQEQVGDPEDCEPDDEIAKMPAREDQRDRHRHREHEIVSHRGFMNEGIVPHPDGDDPIAEGDE